MQVIVSPTFLKGELTAPASKSVMQRACAAALLKKGKTVLHNAGDSDDDRAALEIIRQLGAEVTKEKETIIIQSQGIQPLSQQLNCGESGLSARMFTSIAALGELPFTLTGKGSLLKRPFAFFTEILPQLKVECHNNKGFLPLQIKGPLQPKNISIDGSLSSQFLTGLLFAYAATGAKEVTISVPQLSSKPYIDLTLQVMKEFGLPVPVNDNYKSFYFPGHAPIPVAETFHYTIEGDWSSAAFLLVAGAIAGDLVIKGLDVFSMQADKSILQPLMQSGAHISIEESQLHVRKSQLQPFHFNATDCPDLFPPLVALAAYGKGTSVIEGVHRLTHKESNRALTLQEEMAKMGIAIVLQDDLMLIKGGSVKAASVQARHDHRIAMACAVAALGAEGKVEIEEAEAVSKSYPQFWNDLQKLGAL